ncbi:Lipase [Exophiala dermatitidis]|uniref:Triacylglycerol lipase n=1 Tax=Exophiala dermatitidis (strain ATCC 34100 / CBS 525.76 / NIH/UT8656) TaxID=858893 RepID=H6BS65_EXODN|nr:triacylglycerol lipase [Exophiala dermatitidis NIH/UT8656]EHY54120.1 triacylglycerol lipase [Exophiala dermatitidis NIH/UT8656]
MIAIPGLFFFVVISFLVFAVDALPLSIKKRAISQDLLDTLSLFEQYSAAAYCPENNEPDSSTLITCSAGNCPLVQSAGAESIAEFQNVGLSDATGFVAIDHTHNQIIISFRGSRSVQNFLSDADFGLVSWSSICPGCTVHSGFLDSWTSVKPLIQNAVDGARAAYPNYAIVSTGHSLGGAIATLAAAGLRTAGYGVSLYTYGSPMVGNVALATFVTGQTGQNFRVTHANDLVPKLPGYLLGYAHVSPEYWITSATGVAVTAEDVQTSSGVVDLAGNEGQLGGSVDDHLFYFNEVSACGPDGLEF